MSRGDHGPFDYAQQRRRAQRVRMEMSTESGQETPVNPPDTGSPNSPNAPENPRPQEPNVTPNPAPPSNPTPSNPPNVADPDLMTAINALPERLANVLLERSPRPQETSTESKSEENVGGPNGTGLSWEKKFAKWWAG
jgi:hypothetical protein